MKKIATIDFETEEIQTRPAYPPKPVGVSINYPGKRDFYMAWGHPTENNCTKSEAKRVLKDVYSKYVILCHNGKFDLEVAEMFFGLPLEPPCGWEDSMLLAFLNNPREPSLALKALAGKHLSIPNDEQVKLRQWLFDNVPGARQAKTKWGRFISKAPGKLVGRYAKMDTKMAKGLYNLFIKNIVDKGMLPQYDIEKRVMLKTIEMERVGISIDYKKIKPDLVKAKKAHKHYEKSVSKKLGDINLNSPKQKIEAFERLGLVDEWEYTDKGNPKTSIEFLMMACNDKKLVKDLDMFSRYGKVIGTYMEPWLKSALENNGRFYPWFNTIKGDNNKGTYTGRFSSNFQQAPKEPEDGYKELPFLRRYIVPDRKSHILLNRDFCFSDDTEVLTSSGWKLFKDLNKKECVAQYNNGVITYAKPLAYQKRKFNGKMINISSMKSCDIKVSPDHQCLQLKENGLPVKVKAADYRIGHYKQVVSGIFKGKHDNLLSRDMISLLVAIQADCKINGTKLGIRACFYLKKEKKISRLHGILKRLNVCYVAKQVKSKEGFTGFNFFIPQETLKYLNVGTKTFNRKILNTTLSSRVFFLKELGKWDGSEYTNSWCYYNTRLEHFGMLQELCIVSGVKSVLTYRKRPSRKKCATLSMVTKNYVDTKMFTKEEVDYNGYMYCVTMPQGTVIIRRNGRACVTGNCGQELRILAHFEDGELLSAYLQDPTMDVHNHIKDIMEHISGQSFDRDRQVKPCNFLVIYGGGKSALSRNIKCSLDEAAGILKAHGLALPGVSELKDEMSVLARQGREFVTAGGRWYTFEWDKEYKGVNTLTQGSAADHTKRAFLNIDDVLKTKNYDARIMLTVHDEFMLSAAKKQNVKIMADFKEAMEYDELFDLPMLTDGKMGLNWGDMKCVL